MEIRLASKLQYDSIVDGEGFRTVLWTQGCTHNCKGCHNPSTFPLNGGFSCDTRDLIEELKIEMKYQDGITLSGGDPFLQAKSVLEIAKFVKSINKNVWAFTGFEFEHLLKLSEKNDSIKELLDNIDVLVDGKFEIDKFSYDLNYRGSSNQRIIDVKKSLYKNSIILIEKYMELKKNECIIKKNECIFV